jgi:hypothetical protein
MSEEEIADKSDVGDTSYRRVELKLSLYFIKEYFDILNLLVV